MLKKFAMFVPRSWPVTSQVDITLFFAYILDLGLANNMYKKTKTLCNPESYYKQIKMYLIDFNVK